jgi:hypothetical protein
MQRHEIEILVDSGGLVTGRVAGIKGKSCKAIAELLGSIGRTESAEPTHEYHEEGSVRQTISCAKAGNGRAMWE